MPNNTRKEGEEMKMEPINGHTPLPWFCKTNYPRYGMMGAFKIEVSEEQEPPYGLVIAERGPYDRKAQEMTSNAEFIVHACNSYYANLSTIKAMGERIKELEGAGNALATAWDAHDAMENGLLSSMDDLMALRHRELARQQWAALLTNEPASPEQHR